MYWCLICINCINDKSSLVFALEDSVIVALLGLNVPHKVCVSNLDEIISALAFLLITKGRVKIPVAVLRYLLPF